VLDRLICGGARIGADAEALHLALTTIDDVDPERADR
jgi:hypothetical protein